jgi:hypothetical protein
MSMSLLMIFECYGCFLGNLLPQNHQQFNWTQHYACVASFQAIGRALPLTLLPASLAFLAKPHNRNSFRLNNHSNVREAIDIHSAAGSALNRNLFGHASVLCSRALTRLVSDVASNIGSGGRDNIQNVERFDDAEFICSEGLSDADPDPDPDADADPDPFALRSGRNGDNGDEDDETYISAPESSTTITNDLSNSDSPVINLATESLVLVSYPHPKPPVNLTSPLAFPETMEYVLALRTLTKRAKCACLLSHFTSSLQDLDLTSRLDESHASSIHLFARISNQIVAAQASGEDVALVDVSPGGSIANKAAMIHAATEGNWSESNALVVGASLTGKVVFPDL